jgi:pyruvate dehydrogenase E2 component (dihydrolipoamide acetyltransferase)
VDTPQGLLVPVVRNVNQKSLLQLSGELGELAEKARNKKLGPEEMQGGNFTISNLGGIGGTAFTPIILPPQVAILGVSRAKYEPAYEEEQPQKRLILPLSLSYDHRIIDGADGARFLRWICSVLEDPYNILQ